MTPSCTSFNPNETAVSSPITPLAATATMIDRLRVAGVDTVDAAAEWLPDADDLSRAVSTHDPDVMDSLCRQMFRGDGPRGSGAHIGFSTFSALQGALEGVGHNLVQALVLRPHFMA